MCAPCKKRQQQAAILAMQSRSIAPPVSSGRTLLEGVEFHRKVYVGDSQVVIPSSLSKVSYKPKDYGDVMFVAQQDIEKFPHLWAESETDE